MDPAPYSLGEVEGYLNGRMLDRSGWRGSNLFGAYRERPAALAWSLAFTLDEVPGGSYLAVPILGRHGKEGAYAALRVDGELRGAPDRSVSFPSNVWEYRTSQSERGYTYYFPLDEGMRGKKIEVVVLSLDPEHSELAPEAWITAYPSPFESKTLLLLEAD
jgi:hypothetical protein